MTESVLIEALLRGEESAAETFVVRFGARVHTLLLTFGVPHADVPDVAQEALFDALRQLRIGAFASRSQLFSWLYRIVRGKAVDYRRRPANRRGGTDVSLEALPSGRHWRLTSDADQEAIVVVQEVLAGLPVRLRLLLRWYYEDGGSIPAIAARLNVSEGRVRALLTEAKARCREGVL
jgi:RNA polymerase sigma factor (sigma-70 family)